MIFDNKLFTFFYFEIKIFRPYDFVLCIFSTHYAYARAPYSGPTWNSEKDKHKSLGSIAELTIGQRFPVTLQVTEMSIFFTDFIFERYIWTFFRVVKINWEEKSRYSKRQKRSIDIAASMKSNALSFFLHVPINIRLLLWYLFLLEISI